MSRRQPPPPARAPARSPEIAAVAAELVACGSLEMGADTPEDARRIAELLPAGTPVYVNHLPRHDLEHTLPALIALREAGLEPVPHVAARRIASRAEAQAFLEQAVRLARRAQGAADRRRRATQPVGPYADGGGAHARRICSPAAGSQQVGLAGYPEGPPAHRPPPRSHAALHEKLALAQRAGPRRLRRHPVLASRPTASSSTAPTSPAARPTCRSTSACRARPARSRCCAMRSAAGSAPRCARCRREGMRAVRLFTHVDPTDQLMALARHSRSGSASNVVGVHLYSFGGVARPRTG